MNSANEYLNTLEGFPENQSLLDRDNLCKLLEGYWEWRLATENIEELKHAAKNILNDWNERMGGDIEEQKTSLVDGTNFTYWSPAASLVSSKYIAPLRKLLPNLPK